MEVPRWIGENESMTDNDLEKIALRHRKAERSAKQRAETSGNPHSETFSNDPSRKREKSPAEEEWERLRAE